jgi:hypothetical protein
MERCIRRLFDWCNSIRRFGLLIICILLLFIMTISCHTDTNYYRIEKVIKNQWLDKYASHANIDVDIKSAVDFSENLINEYIKELNERIISSHKGSFTFWKKQNISARSAFSDIAEFFIYIYPSEKNEIIIDYTKMPIQIEILHKLIDINDHKIVFDR